MKITVGKSEFWLSFEHKPVASTHDGLRWTICTLKDNTKLENSQLDRHQFEVSGIAYVNPKDIYKKSLGREISLGRCLKIVSPSIRKGVLEAYNQRNTVGDTTFPVWVNNVAAPTKKAFKTSKTTSKKTSRKTSKKTSKKK